MCRAADGAWGARWRPQDKAAPPCAGCGAPALSERLYALGRLFHRKCFVCAPSLADALSRTRARARSLSAHPRSSPVCGRMRKRVGTAQRVDFWASVVRGVRPSYHARVEGLARVRPELPYERCVDAFVPCIVFPCSCLPPCLRCFRAFSFCFFFFSLMSSRCPNAPSFVVFLLHLSLILLSYPLYHLLFLPSELYWLVPFLVMSSFLHVVYTRLDVQQQVHHIKRKILFRCFVVHRSSSCLLYTSPSPRDGLLS
eukprot:6177725-Pleurochrysis_carterae.AAC.6